MFRLDKFNELTPVATNAHPAPKFWLSIKRNRDFWGES
jgi:hypothetical protein